MENSVRFFFTIECKYLYLLFFIFFFQVVVFSGFSIQAYTFLKVKVYILNEMLYILKRTLYI
jgi:hypothetical protein